MLIDSHCHLDRLDLKPFEGDFDRFMAKAREEGISHMLCVGINLPTFERCAALAARYPEEISLSAGEHPNDSKGQPLDVEQLLEYGRRQQVVAIGETGLDYFRSEGDLSWQQERFRQHIQVAKTLHKPLIVHSRAAKEDTLRIWREEGAMDVGGVLHCFAEDWDMARRALDLNLYISFSGIVTFKNAQAIQEAARKVPEDRFLIETDSPYLAPVPYRGKPNYPFYVRKVAEKIAELRGTTLERVGETSGENFYRLFSLALNKKHKNSSE
ncbi:TatD DNase family protein [Methylomarinovum caldicuralii]|uniref:TatD DNase family protein n=1 Tax=Methylomarinovum caldicuralii TaxID=438856 RepID=A0AAU9C588_9GAMM|nr:TatD family hydrolase [Methylomarinovum caldicuralii]BCX82269.1 TatD DNase family protein [Methylomarinovum caldicuralii]